MKKAILGISPFLVQVLAVALNFNSLLQGSTATAVNTVVSLIYFAFWIYFTHALRRYNAHRGLLLSLAFWSLVLLTSLLTLAVNIFDFDLPALIPFTILFLAPTYGIRLAPFTNVVALTIVALAALAYITCNISGLKNASRDKSKE